MKAIIPQSKKAVGEHGEELAAQYLARQGLVVVARNFRIRAGEIDLICRDGPFTVFVEVRCRASGDFGSAAESITAGKKRRILQAARAWLARHGESPCRFDCVLLEQGRITWLKGAFSAD